MGDGADMAREAEELAALDSGFGPDPGGLLNAIRLAKRVARQLLRRKMLESGDYWISKDGRTHRFREMESTHLVNVCRMLERVVDTDNRAEEARVTMAGEGEPPDPDGPRILAMADVPPYRGARRELAYRDRKRWPEDLATPVDGPGKLGGDAYQAKLATMEKKRDVHRE